MPTPGGSVPETCVLRNCLTTKAMGDVCGVPHLRNSTSHTNRHGTDACERRLCPEVSNPIQRRTIWKRGVSACQPRMVSFRRAASRSMPCARVREANAGLARFVRRRPMSTDASPHSRGPIRAPTHGAAAHNSFSCVVRPISEGMVPERDAQPPFL